MMIIWIVKLNNILFLFPHSHVLKMIKRNDVNINFHNGVTVELIIHVYLNKINL
jgi:hypothetical protein